MYLQTSYLRTNLRLQTWVLTDAHICDFFQGMALLLVNYGIWDLYQQTKKQT